MTFYSLQLAECPAEATDEQRSKSGAPPQQLDSLSRRARDWGAYGLGGWAEKRALKIHYVDNCWVRVELSVEDVAAFYDELGLPFPALSAGRRYIIEAEEY